MSDPSAVPSALGIEAVEWIAEGGENLTVRVTGRWRRRRPAWSGKPTLVVEAPGRRYRFPAMPEPPSLSGAGPGTWRISFSVPAALAPELGGRSWLQFGSVAVPLPSAIEPPGAPEHYEEPVMAEPPPYEVEPTAELDEPGGFAESEPEPAWTDEEGLTQRAEQAEAAVAALTGVVRDLERDLAVARARADELSESLDSEQRDRRSAEQREHAERALRLDLARQVAAHSREAHRAREAYGELAEAEARVRELESELDTARRRIDEAEQAAAAAISARDRAEEIASDARREAELARRHRAEAERARLGLEQHLSARRRSSPARVPDEPARLAVTTSVAAGLRAAEAVVASGPAGAEAETDGIGAAVTPGAEALVSALRAELDLRAGAEAGLRARMIDAEARLAAREQLTGQTEKAMVALRHELGGLRHELGRLRAALGSEREARIAAEQRVAELERALGTSRARSRDALAAIGEIRGALASLAPPPPAARPRSEVEPERLNEALARLREQTAPPAEEPAPAPQEPVPAAPEPAAAAAEPPAAVTEPPAAVTEPPAAVTEPPAAVTEPPAAVAEPPAVVPDVVAPEVPAERPAEPEAVAAPEVPAERAAEPEAPDAPTRAWLEPLFRELVREDPDRAGRLLVELLPAQHAVIDEPVAYDLQLGGHDGTVQVTVADGPARVVTAKAPRSPADVAFTITGDHAELARVLYAGPLKRRFGREVARVRGRWGRVAHTLRALVSARLDLRELHRLGVRLDPLTAMTLVAGLIDADETLKERFAVAYLSAGEEVYLLIRGGAPPGVTTVRPAGRIALTVTGPAGSLEQVLSGEGDTTATVTGDEWPLALLRKWIKAAQSG